MTTAQPTIYVPPQPVERVVPVVARAEGTGVTGTPVLKKPEKPTMDEETGESKPGKVKPVTSPAPVAGASGREEARKKGSPVRKRTLVRRSRMKKDAETGEVFLALMDKGPDGNPICPALERTLDNRIGRPRMCHLDVRIGDTIVDTCVDSGATYTLLSNKVYQEVQQ